MNTVPETEWYRVRISGSLECTTDLHIGDGDQGRFGQRSMAKEWQSDDASRRLYNSVCLRAPTEQGHRHPYIPASSLRGRLRRLAATRLSALTLKTLFGSDRGESGHLEGGKLRVFDAVLRPAETNPAAEQLPYWCDNRKTWIRRGIALNERTGTVEEHHLYATELVPAGTVFSMVVELDRPEQQEIEAVLELFGLFDGSAQSAIGGSTGVGNGRVRWDPDEDGLGGIDTSGFRRWLLHSDEPLENAYSPLGITPPSTTDRPAAAVTLRLCTLSPLLCAEPRAETTNNNAETEPLRFVRGADGDYRIPGETLKGALRGRARKILRTIACSQQNSANPPIANTALLDSAAALANVVFGSTSRRGLVELESARCTKSSPHTQYFNAIDRFTGGGKHGAIYSVEALHGAVFETAVNLRPRTGGIDNWILGLAAYVARDALENETRIGWGESRGFGRISLKLDYNGNCIRNWEEFIECFSEETLRRWVEALHNKIGELTQDA